jgi:hypothetical protein
MEELAVAEASACDRLPDLLQRAFAGAEPGTEVVLVTTRTIDVVDRQRFPSLAADPQRRSLAQRVRVINTSDASLSDYFQT